MRTYQDLIEVGENEAQRMEFVRKLIFEYKLSEMYKTAETADLYNRRKNKTITEYQKVLYTITGRTIPDNVSANYKMCSGFFQRFTIQEVQYLLSNGISWQNPESVESRLGKNIDNIVAKMAEAAVVGGTSYGFFNLDHIEFFKATEFVPLYDEETGVLNAGVRFWQLDTDKPLRATLYEKDGYTEYIWKHGQGSIRQEKRSYILNISASEADGMEIVSGENYSSFPIVPLWANDYHQSELIGIQEQIDCYDLIKSGFANTVDEASFIYWTLKNAGGMDDIDLAKFIEQIKTLHATYTDDEIQPEAHSLDVPYEGREALLDRLSADLYRDAMALDVDRIASGAMTATQIIAAYENLDAKASKLEYQILIFLAKIMQLAGVEDVPTFTRSKNTNVAELVQVVLQAAQYLDSDYVTSKILELLGDGDKADDMIKKLNADSMQRIS